jgi:hypothetical protein
VTHTENSTGNERPDQHNRRGAAIQYTFVGFWVVAIVPTLLWWKDSVLWVALMSLWANIAAHWSAAKGAQAKKAAEE